MFADRANWNLEPNRLSEALAHHRASGKLLLDLTASNPIECGFEYDAPAILHALSDVAALSYKPDPKGLLAARQAVAAYYAERGNEVSVEDILLTTGTSEAYSFILRLMCNPGDELLIPTPSYPLFDLLADVQDVKLSSYPLRYDHGWQFDFHALEEAITSRTRGVIVVHPNNPTGNFCKPEETAKLNQFCASHELALMVDEVFLDFVIARRQPASFAGNSAALTFTLSGLSKISGLPQMKAAWVAVSGPQEMKKQAMARLEIISDVYLSMNAPVQLALPVLLELRHGFQNQWMARVKRNLSELERQLALQKCCGRLGVEGGWNAVLRVPAARSDEELAIELLESKGVYVHPGHYYDFSSDGYFVVSLIVPEQTFAEGIKRLLSIFA